MSQNQPASTSTLITWLVATIGGLSVLLYLAGIVVVTMRLVLYRLPFEDAIADLPQSYFATVAFIEMFIPSLLVAAGYLLARYLLIYAPPGPFHYDPEQPNDKRTWVWAASFAGWMALLLYFIFGRQGNVLIFWQFWVLGAFVAVGTATLCYELAIAAPSTARTRHAPPKTEDPRKRRILPRTHSLTVATIALLVALASLPYVVTFNSIQPLEDVKICPEQGGQTAWRMIGENGDRIWVGERSGSSRHVVWLSNKSAKSVWIGTDVAGRICP
jgi:hypothetical protein